MILPTSPWKTQFVGIYVLLYYRNIDRTLSSEFIHILHVEAEPTPQQEHSQSLGGLSQLCHVTDLIVAV